MQSFIWIWHLLSLLLLQLAPAQISHPPEEGHSRVMAFQEVWAKSMCRPMEQLVDVEQEYPGDVEYIYLPGCVPLWRCSGCCGDETVECQATLESNVTLQVMRIHPMTSMHHVELTFVEHQRCECRARQNLLHNKSISESIKNKPRRRKHKKTTTGCGKCQFPQNKMNPL
ncbi:vascular endothelial growth factor A-like [Sebastes umbrosus]|uniref:vascular endothelial growth factor A-like n=1 Tax=Sebastes umbrosus TaxID=72105 RepID=UPI00189D662F|nr:vascular endothelial growth factor A-like [Sebastes umbrosus]